LQRIGYLNNYSESFLYGAISKVLGASVALLAIFQIPLTHTDNTTTEDGNVVARGNTTIVPVSDFDAYSVDDNASAVKFVVFVYFSKIYELGGAGAITST
jgi:hypothetical protein